MRMSERPTFYNGRLSPMEVALKAEQVEKTKRLEGDAVSSKVAVALAIQEEAKNTIKETIKKGRGRIDGENLSYGMGGLLFGSIVKSLEEGIIKGWNDEEVFDDFNIVINETSLVAFSFPARVFLQDGMRTRTEETAIIREESKRDSTFLGFFEPNINKLPQSLQNLLRREYLSGVTFNNSVSLILPVYKEAIKFIK